MDSSRPTPERLMQFAFGYAPALMIEAAVRNGVFDALAHGAKGADQVSAETGASQRGLRAVMNGLVGLGFLGKDAKGNYSLTPESESFLVQGKPGYLGGFFRHVSGQMLPSWIHLSDVVRSGSPHHAVNQESAGSEFFQQFVEDLFPLGYPVAQVLAEALGISRLERPARVLDLAAGSGVWSIALAQKSPHVRVTAVDWPGVLPVTRRTTARFGLEGRYTFVAGDLLEADFGGGFDFAVLGHILHSEGEERSRALLKKTFQALAPGGTIAIAEWLVNQERTGPPNGLIFAVNMLVHTDRGDTFSFEEIGAWAMEAGFTNPRLLEVPGPSPLILATKA